MKRYEIQYQATLGGLVHKTYVYAKNEELALERGTAKAHEEIGGSVTVKGIREVE